MTKKLGDYDIWYRQCTKCGYDPGRSSNHRESCWKCGNRVYRDFSERALKNEVKQHLTVGMPFTINIY